MTTEKAKSIKPAKTEATTQPQTVAGIPVATPEQQAAAEAAAAAKAKKEQDKKDADALKLKTATDTVTAKYTELQTTVQTGTDLISTLVETSSVDDVKKVKLGADESLKSARGILKDIKAAARKVKDNENLSQAVTAADGLVANLDTNIKGLAGKVNEAKLAEKNAKKAQREKDAADAKAKREADRAANAMPEQNGVRRPKPDTLCGKAWELCDKISASLGSPAPISYVIQAAESAGLNEGNVRAEYARWKKFNGVEGRVAVPLPKEVAEAAKAVAAPGKAPEAGDPVTDPAAPVAE